MKKLLGIVMILTLMSGVAVANCKSDIEFKWGKTGTNNISFVFENKGSKHIRITKVYVKDSEGDIISDAKPINYNSLNKSKGWFVKPKEKSILTYGWFNAHEYGKKAGWKCTYQKPYEKSLEEKFDGATDSVGSTIKGWFKDED